MRAREATLWVAFVGFGTAVLVLRGASGLVDDLVRQTGLAAAGSPA
ncbi:hypothetical protein [Nocardioides sp. CER19]|nr:hypothetical protein [Nocardioides sp. CER19]MDH2414407.1 hypothetical protein [Nocardioides sp. CER19]